MRVMNPLDKLCNIADSIEKEKTEAGTDAHVDRYTIVVIQSLKVVLLEE